MGRWGFLARRSFHAVREQGPRRVAMIAMGRALNAVGGKALHYAQRPTVLDFAELSDTTTDPSIMAAALGCPEPDFARYLQEFEEDFNEAHQDLASLRFPYACRSELNTQRVLYSLIRAHKPSVALETGVADGFSSFAILSALEANGGGHLHSIDIRSDVGVLVPRHLEGRWTLHVIDDQEQERSTKKTLSTMPGIDFYYHDSGHSYLWQAFEYATVVLKMTGGGVFLSDDVDWSYAFIDHCETRREKPTLMLDRRKLIGGYIVSA